MINNSFFYCLVLLWSSISCGFVTSLAIHDIDVTVSGDDSLPIYSVQQMVRVDGSHARVIVDVIALLPPDSGDPEGMAEGTFKIELPTGASPFLIGFGVEEKKDDAQDYFLSYSIGDGWTLDEIADLRKYHSPSFKVARMAGKAIAAQSFTEIVNQNVDPAILEGGAAGSFSTRLFPFFSNKLHRITLGYDVPMEYGVDTNRLRYDLPIPSGNSRNKSPEIRVELMTYEEPIFLDQSAEYIVQESLPLLVQVYPMTADDRSYTVEFQHDFATNNAANTLLSLRATPLAWGVVNDVHHFETSFFIPELPSRDEIVSTETSQSHVVFAIETSFTTARDQGSMERYQEIVTAVLENDPAIDYFNIMVFDIGVQWLAPPDGEWILNGDSTRVAAIEFLSSILLEGATDHRLALDVIIDQQQKQAHLFDLFLMSSGAVTWGESDPNRIVALLSSSDSDNSEQQSLILPRRVHTYHVGSSGGDPTLLRRLSNARGGVFTSVDPATKISSPSEVTQHLQPRIALKSITVEGTLDVVISGAKYGSDPLLVVRSGQTVQISWRASSSDARTLRVEFFGDSSLDALNVTLPLPMAPTNIGVRAYGILANAALEELLPLSEDICRSVALYYRVVGRTASLIMLESEEQYKDYNIIESHFFSSVQDIYPSQVVQEFSAQASRVARSAFSGLLDFLDKIQATGVQFAFPDDVSTLLYKAGLSDSSIDIASRARIRTDSNFDRTAATIQSNGLRLKLEENPEADYDSWTAESDARKAKGSLFAALRALTSLLAQQPGDFVLRRDVALSSIELGFPTGAYYALEQVAETRPWEPMSYFQMAQTAQASGLPDLALVLFEVSLAGDWQPRFKAFQEVSGMLYARHLRQINDGKADTEDGVAKFAATREPEIRALFTAAEQAGMVVFMTWNQDSSDIDLHVTEPNGETCSYSNMETKSGGRLFGDVTQGYGPELYVQSNLKERGDYKIEVNVFSPNQNRLSAPIKVLVEVFTDWGFSNDEYQAFTTVGRDSNQGLINVATITLESPTTDIVKLPVGDGTMPVMPVFNPIFQFIGSVAPEIDMDDESMDDERSGGSSSSGAGSLGIDFILWAFLTLLLTLVLVFV
mmetsp:Transcript_15403/g.18724  ORF Transcript_15403/g.18724 Transcript_15403/m.18724 type:complete len:1106 (+) Transcript_15403:116-3433(+)